MAKITASANGENRYLANIGDTDLNVLEVFATGDFQEISLNSHGTGWASAVLLPMIKTMPAFSMSRIDPGIAVRHGGSKNFPAAKRQRAGLPEHRLFH